jgi:hypothetical protein
MAPNTKYVGTISRAPVYYHRTRRFAPLWAHCVEKMFVDRMPEGDMQLEERGLRPCRECWPPSGVPKD